MQTWTNYFAGRASKPKFHAKDRTTPSFTIPQDIKIGGGKLYIPTVGWVRTAFQNWQESPRHGNKRYGSVTYEIDESVRVDSGVTAGSDRNASDMIAGAYSDDTPDEAMEHPAKKVYETKEKRHHRQLSKQLDRREKDGRTKMSGCASKTLWRVNKWRRTQRNCRHNRNHQNSARIAKKVSTVKLEKLPVRGMTRSAKGTKENPART